MGAFSHLLCSSFPPLSLAARGAVFERNCTAAKETQRCAAELSGQVLQPVLVFGFYTRRIIFFFFFPQKNLDRNLNLQKGFKILQWQS